MSSTTPATATHLLNLLDFPWQLLSNGVKLVAWRNIYWHCGLRPANMLLSLLACTAAAKPTANRLKVGCLSISFTDPDPSVFAAPVCASVCVCD